MPVFVPLEQPRELPATGTAIERAVTDWKSKDTSTHFHKAKDVAAFANHLGGTIVVGAVEVKMHLQAYSGLEPAEAARVRREYSEAITQRCDPHPRFDFEEYPCPGATDRVVVAVNVWPSLLLVGVWVTAHKPTEGYEGHSFVFPVRAGTDADYLTPGQLAMYMTPQVRRVAVMLSRLEPGTKVTIRMLGASPQVLAFEQLHEEQNLVSFSEKSGTGDRSRHLPLDRILTVFEDWDSATKVAFWSVTVDRYW